MLHDETRKLLIEAWNKTHNAKEIAECFSVNTSTVYRPEKQMRETGSVKTRTSQRGRKHALTPEEHQKEGLFMDILNTVSLESNSQIRINFDGGDLSSDAGNLSDYQRIL